MGTVVLDAGVVIGWFEQTDVHHEAAVAAINRHAIDDVSLPASAYAEVLVRPIRRGGDQIAKRLLRDAGIKIEPIEEKAAELAAALRARHRTLRLPDALVLGHAEAIGADVVLTTDARWKRVSPRVEVV